MQFAKKQQFTSWLDPLSSFHGTLISFFNPPPYNEKVEDCVQESGGKSVRFLTLLLLVSTLLLRTEPVAAQDAATATRFDILHFNVVGTTAPLRVEDIDRIVSPFIGPRKSFDEMQRARDALQQAYQNLGRCGARVVLPRRTPDNGVVELRVVDDPAA
ncbi:MAG TPA: POTRA domain-containing protein, partial [Burkholderiales bacterium]|nr:POTRA domain-containing protein [Burkholderiales bacterium]